MKNPRLTLFIVTTGALLTFPFSSIRANATVVYSDNFDGYVVGTDYSADDSSFGGSGFIAVDPSNTADSTNVLEQTSGDSLSGSPFSTITGPATVTFSGDVRLVSENASGSPYVISQIDLADGSGSGEYPLDLNFDAAGDSGAAYVISDNGTYNTIGNIVLGDTYSFLAQIDLTGDSNDTLTVSLTDLTTNTFVGSAAATGLYSGAMPNPDIASLGLYSTAGTSTYDDLSLSVEAVPEPQTGTLLAIGSLGLLLLVLHRRRISTTSAQA